MQSLRNFAPHSLLTILEENAEANNMPRIGVPDNFAFPAVQLNIASGVEFDECQSTSYAHLHI